MGQAQLLGRVIIAALKTLKLDHTLVKNLIGPYLIYQVIYHWQRNQTPPSGGNRIAESILDFNIQPRRFQEFEAGQNYRPSQHSSADSNALRLVF